MKSLPLRFLGFDLDASDGIGPIQPSVSSASSLLSTLVRLFSADIVLTYFLYVYESFISG